MTQQAIFQRLTKHLHRGGSWGYWWTNGRRAQWWPAGYPAQIPAAWAGRDVYFGVHPTSTKGKRGTIATTTALNCVFAEFDAKDFVQPDEYNPHLPGNFDQLDVKNQADAIAEAKRTEAARLTIYKGRAFAHISSLTPQPSIIIDSGGGYHCYWLLSETFHIASGEDRSLAQSVQYAWIDLVGSDGGAKDLARVLRVPGQMNHKYRPARPVEFVSSDFDLLYTWSTIFELTTEKRAENEAKKRSKPAQLAPDAQRLPVSIDDVELIEKAKTAPKFAGLWAGDWSGYDSQSSADLALANLLTWWTNHDAARADRLFRSSGLMRPKWDQAHRASDGATYGQMTLEKADRDTAGGYTGQRRTADILAAFVDDWHSHAPEAGELYHEDGALTHDLTDELQPNETDIIRAEIDALRTWLHSQEGAQELRDRGLVRVDTYRKCMDALCGYAHVHALRTLRPGLARLGEAYNASVHTVRNHLRKLETVGLVTVDWEARPISVKLAPVPNFTPDLHRGAVEGGVKLGTGQQFFIDNRPDDAFLYSHAAFKKRRQRRGLDEGIAPFGATGLTIAAALAEHGPLTRSEIREITGSGKYAIAKATRRMAAAGVLLASEGIRGQITYELPVDYAEKLNEVRPTLQTDGTLDRRKRQNAIHALAWAKADPDTSPRRLAKLENKVDRLEGGPAAKWITRWKPRHRAPVDTSERSDALAHLQQVERDLRDAPDEDKAFYLECAGYSEMDIALICSGRVRYMKATDGVKVDARRRRIPAEQKPARPAAPSKAEREGFNNWVKANALQVAAD